MRRQSAVSGTIATGCASLAQRTRRFDGWRDLSLAATCCGAVPIDLPPRNSLESGLEMDALPSQ
jgi:hypothetical protein